MLVSGKTHSGQKPAKTLNFQGIVDEQVRAYIPSVPPEGERRLNKSDNKIHC